jgi:hypothetical protein
MLSNVKGCAMTERGLVQLVLKEPDCRSKSRAILRFLVESGSE